MNHSNLTLKISHRTLRHGLLRMMEKSLLRGLRKSLGSKHCLSRFCTVLRISSSVSCMRGNQTNKIIFEKAMTSNTHHTKFTPYAKSAVIHKGNTSAILGLWRYGRSSRISVELCSLSVTNLLILEQNDKKKEKKKRLKPLYTHIT